MMCYLITCAPPTNAPVQDMRGVNDLSPRRSWYRKILAVLVRSCCVDDTMRSRSHSKSCVTMYSVWKILRVWRARHDV